jgi:hypothetical protein
MFLLQSIGVQVASAQADLDESTVPAILQGKTHAPKSLIVREEPSCPKTTGSQELRSRIKIIENRPPRLARARPRCGRRAPAAPAGRAGAHRRRCVRAGCGARRRQAGSGA